MKPLFTSLVLTLSLVFSTITIADPVIINRISIREDGAVWTPKGICGAKPAKFFHAGESGNRCVFIKYGHLVSCRTKSGSMIDYLFYFARNGNSSAVLELIEYRGATGAPDAQIELERCPNKIRK